MYLVQLVLVIVKQINYLLLIVHCRSIPENSHESLPTAI
jgi:hypothetical protein